MKTTPPATVEQYLAEVENESFRAALVELRRIILDAAPNASEMISYGIPTFKVNKTVISMAAFKQHCSFFPGSTLDDFIDEVKGYKTSRGTIQFKPDNPLPADLVRRIVKARFEL